MNDETPAERLVSERRELRGDPRAQFTRLAVMVSALLDTTVSASDMVLIMLLVKITREQYAHDEDNLTDLEGYTVILRQLTQTDTKETGREDSTDPTTGGPGDVHPTG